MKYLNNLIVVAFLSPFIHSGLHAQIDLAYQEPPEEIRVLADAVPTPSVRIDDKAVNIVLLYRSAYKTIEEVSAKEYRLAGLRINPKTNTYSRATFYNRITLLNAKDGTEDELQLPERALISNFSWSPNFDRFAFTVSSNEGTALWIAEVKTRNVKQLTGADLNDVLRGNPYTWAPDGNYLLCRFVDPNRGDVIPEDRVPTGPIVQESIGKTAPARTYQDLLKNKTDEKNFEYFTHSVIKKVDMDGSVSDFLPRDIYLSLSFSPDGKYLLTRTVHRPYSYLVPYYRFPQKTSILNKDGGLVKELFDAPLEEERPKGFMATTKAPREHNWRPDVPSTVYWAEALDDGDPKKEVDFRDAVYELDAPFNGKSSEILKTRQRYYFIQWGGKDLAVAYDYWFSTRNRKVYLFNPLNPAESKKVIFDINTEDLYKLPGNFATETNKYGRTVLLRSRNERTLYLIGEGHSPEGNKPFVSAYDTKTGTTHRIWQAGGENTYEKVIDVIDVNRGEILTRIESTTENPNYYIRNIYKQIAPRQITNFPNSYESLKSVSKELIHYKRDDGTDLTAVLYLPAEYNMETDGRLPVFMWAYPREFKNAKAAGQVKDSPHRFSRIGRSSPLYWVVRGYAVLDRADFPIIGEGEVEPNDTFVEQLVANGKAAIDALVERGIADPNRVGVGGHSYGAFMTANLLAHSDFFAAGIARSGAYNRSLTPFGFQREERTFWEAPDLYFKMSPFMHADDINEPILLIHGTADNNSGTFPMQSERLYNAIKGHGGTVRLVMLPDESHGYAARESVMHMLWEMDNWLEKYVKNRKPLEDTQIDTMNK